MASPSSCQPGRAASAVRNSSGVSARRCCVDQSCCCKRCVLMVDVKGSGRRRHARQPGEGGRMRVVKAHVPGIGRSEEHTSELQSHLNLVCRLLLEKKKKKNKRCR